MANEAVLTCFEPSTAFAVVVITAAVFAAPPPPLEMITESAAVKLSAALAADEPFSLASWAGWGFAITHSARNIFFGNYRNGCSIGRKKKALRHTDWPV